jgi:imidazolonepropionase-like amidohydrolase
MNVFYDMYDVYAGDTSASYKPILTWMPADQRENVAATSSFGPADQKETYTASFSNMMAMLKKLYDSGILLVSGTDGGEAFALEHELELYVQAGIPPLNTLQTATYNAAKDCNLQNQFGSIAVGKQADMILIEGNPDANISDIRRVQWVIKNNREYDPKKLFASIGWSYYY